MCHKITKKTLNGQRFSTKFQLFNYLKTLGEKNES